MRAHNAHSNPHNTSDMIEASQLSDREREILTLVATGATNQQIAQQLDISPNTVKVHLRNIFAKLGVASRTEATLYAMRTGLVAAQPGVGGALVAPEPPLISAPPDVAITVVAPPPAVEIAPADPPAPVGADVLALESPRATAERTAPEPVPLPAIPVPATEPVRGPTPTLNRFLLIGLIGAVVLVIALALALMQSNTDTPAASSLTSTPPSPTPEPPPAELVRWRDLPAMPAGRSDFALSAITTNTGGALYAIGGISADDPIATTLRYEIATAQWTPLADKPTPVTAVQAVAIGQRIYVPGGQTADGSISAVLEMYDPQTDTWTALRPIPAPRSRYALTALDGKLYLFGGWDGTNYSDAVWRYNPDDDTWQRLNNMPTLLADAGAVAVDGLIYLIGGENASGPLNQSMRYNPADEGRVPWSSMPPLPEPRARMGITLAGTQIFVVGGNLTSSDLLIFNPSTNIWERQSTPLDPLLGMRAQTLSGKVFVLGGEQDTAPRADLAEYTVTYTVIVPIN